MADQAVSWSDRRFLAALQLQFGDWLGTLGAPGRRRAYPLALVRAERLISRRAVLIGNAAHSLHPVAGQGFNLGLRDVAALAELLLETVGGGADIGDRQLLQAYSDWRRRDISNTIRFTDSLISLFANDSSVMALGRNAALATLNRCQPAKRLLLRRAMGLNGRLPRLCRGLPLARLKHGANGFRCRYCGRRHDRCRLRRPVARLESVAGAAGFEAAAGCALQRPF